MERQAVSPITAPPASIGHNRPTKPVTIDPKSFPDQSQRGDGIPCTIDNVRHMLDANSVTVRYDVMKKRTEIDVPWVTGTTENADSVAMTHIQSMASRYAMPTGMVPAVVHAIAEANSYNPIADWIGSKAWDGKDRLPEICNTITPREGYPSWLRDILITKWLLSAVAAVLMGHGFRCRGVLTLQGPQSMGKTSWGLRLINDAKLRERYIKVDHHLDAGSKDSLLGAVDHFICEIGELESTLKRDLAKLKGFLTSGFDKVRKPYAYAPSEYQRRTVFYATVNDAEFLIDRTGNARWWTIPCAHIEHQHDIDMQQVFAQLAVELEAGAEWWLTPEEEALLEQHNSRHRAVSVVREKVLEFLESDHLGGKVFTASEVLQHAGIERPTNPQAKECGAILRELYGESRRIKGRDKWRIPKPEIEELAETRDEDDDEFWDSQP